MWNGSMACSCFPFFWGECSCHMQNWVFFVYFRWFTSEKRNCYLFFGNQISKWRSFENRAIFDLLFTFFSHQGKLQTFLQHISHSHTYTYFAHPINFFCLINFEKIWIYQIRFLFGMSPSVDSSSRHFGTINK